MATSRTARAATGLIAGVITLTGLGVMTAAGPAQAASHTCNSSYAWKTGLYNGKNTFAWVPSYNQDTTLCNLAPGDSGDPVERLQRALNMCYGQSLVIDGNFGSKTKEALRVAQRVERIEDDGYYGPITRKSLEWPRRYIQGETWIGSCIRTW